MTVTYHAADYFRESTQPIAIMRITDKRPTLCPSHSHDFDELVLVLRGAATHTTDEETYTLKAGDIFLLQGRQTHSFREQWGFSYVNLLFRPALLELPWSALRVLPGYQALLTLEPALRRRHEFQSRLHVTAADLRYLHTLVSAMEVELSHREAGYEAVLTAHFAQLLVYLARCYARMSTPSSQQLLQLGAALSLLERQYMTPLRLEELANAACMSVSTFSRAFKRATGFSPISYLLRLRIHKAAELLRDDAVSVACAAEQVGFTDSNYFTRQFTAIMGVCPRIYQRSIALR